MPLFPYYQSLLFPAARGTTWDCLPSLKLLIVHAARGWSAFLVFKVDSAEQAGAKATEARDLAYLCPYLLRSQVPGCLGRRRRQPVYRRRATPGAPRPAVNPLRSAHDSPTGVGAIAMPFAHAICFCLWKVGRAGHTNKSAPISCRSSALCMQPVPARASPQLWHAARASTQPWHAAQALNHVVRHYDHAKKSVSTLVGTPGKRGCAHPGRESEARAHVRTSVGAAVPPSPCACAHAPAGHACPRPREYGIGFIKPISGLAV